MAVEGSNSLFFASGIDLTGLQQGAAGAVGIVSGLAKTIASINPFAALTVGAIAAFAAIGKEATDFAKQYELAMLEVKTISAATREDFEKISSSIFRLSKDTLDDPKELAEAYYQIVSAGYDGAAGLELLKVASQAATAGVTTTQVAADGITTALNAFNLEASQAEEVADAMFKTVELGKTTFDQLAANLSTVAPLASTFGVSMQEVLAATASLTKQGVPTAQAMTQIRAAMVGVNEVLGDGWANAYTLQEAFQEVFEQADGSTAILKESIGRIEGTAAILSLVGDNAAGAADDLRDVSEAAGSADRAFGIMMDGSINQSRQLKNRLRALTEELGRYGNRITNDIVKGLNRWLRNENEVSDAMRETQIELRASALAILDESTAQEDRIKLLEKVKEIAPGVIDDIDLETASYEELEKALRLANDQLDKKIRLQLLEERKIPLQDRYTDAVEEQVRLEEKIERLALTLEDTYRERGAAIDASLPGLEKFRDLSAQVARIREDQGLVTGTDEGDFLFALNASIKGYEDATTAADTYLRKINEIGKTVEDREVTFGVKLDPTDIDKTIQDQLDQIAKSTNVSALTEFLNSENEQIVKAAKARKKALQEEFKPTSDFDRETATENIRVIKAAYQDYEAFRLQFGDEVAAKRYRALLKEGANWEQYWRIRINQAKSFAEQEFLAYVGAQEKFIRERKPEKYLVFQEQDLFEGPEEIPIEVALLGPSVDEVEANLQRLYDAYDATREDNLRKQIADEIDAQELMLDNLRKHLKDKDDAEDNYLDIRQGRSIKFHLEEIKRLKKEREELRKANKLNTEEGQKNLDDLTQNQREAVDKITEWGDIIRTSLGGLADIFEKFGSDDMAKALRQAAEVASASTTLAAGIVTGDPRAIVQGAVDFLNSAITVEIVSDTAEFEKQIKDLERTVQRLDNTMRNSIGEDRIDSRRDIIAAEEELQKLNQEAIEAERKARKEVKFLGITVSKKGSGSGTDPEKIKELEDAAEAARQRVIDLQKEINELFTGTTSQSIVDSIVSGFEEGKRSAEDFAGTFEDLMRNAVLESLKLKYLEGAVEAFFEDFAEAAESGGGLSSTEINQLRERFNTLIATGQQELDALNEILGQAGIASTIGSQAQGLQGEIETITEETANILAGTLNKIMIDTADQLEAVRESVFYLSEINLKLGEMIEQNDTANARLLAIETALS